jgi:hypothetical protein
LFDVLRSRLLPILQTVARNLRTSIKLEIKHISNFFENLMEPLTTAAIAIGTIMGTKALEKAGEKIGETLSNKIGRFLSALKKQSPQTATAIEKAPEQPLNYSQVEQEVKSAANANTEVNQAIQELVAAANTGPNPKLAEILAMPNLQKLADKIGQVVMPGGTGNIETMNL